MCNKKILVSACLCGRKCRYDGKSANNKIIDTLDKNRIIEICPEILGGLTIPREPCEIVGGTAKDVLKGKAKILSKTGTDYTKEYKTGVEKILKIVDENEIERAVLKQNSPSCGYGKIYDGSFTGKKIRGNGILAEMLGEKKIKILSVE